MNEDLATRLAHHYLDVFRAINETGAYRPLENTIDAITYYAQQIENLSDYDEDDCLRLAGIVCFLADASRDFTDMLRLAAKHGTDMTDAELRHSYCALERLLRRKQPDGLRQRLLDLREQVTNELR